MGSRRLSIAVLVLVVPLAVSSLFPKTMVAQVEVRGRVVAAPDSLPRGGVSVRVKGAETGVLSNSSGEYRITVPNPTDTLVFSYLGFETLEVPVSTEEPVNVVLAPARLDLESPTISFGTFRAPGPPASCAQSYSPMPGSAFDPNWQRENPELARLMAPGCTPTPPRPPLVTPVPPRAPEVAPTPEPD